MSRLSILTFAGCALLGMVLPVFGQEKKDAPRDDKAREKKIQELMEQQRKIQAELAKEGALGPGGIRPPGAPGGPGFDPEAMQKMMREQMARMIDEARLRGELGAADPRAAQERMQKMALEAGPQGVIGAPGGPQAIIAQQMAAMLRMSEAGGTGPGAEANDHFEVGQRMVIAGLEAQLRGMADRIRATPDEETKKKLSADFKELIGKVAEARKKRRDQQIAQLEKKLADLKAQTDESADDLAKRLLEGGPKPEATPEAK